VNSHTASFKHSNQWPMLGKHGMNFMSVVGKAAKHSLHATAGPINIGRIVDGENSHIPCQYIALKNMELKAKY
jgi:hypothetical protein